MFVTSSFAAGVAAVSLAIRKRTWRISGEASGSVAVLCLGLAAPLLSRNNGLDSTLWRLTGNGYLDDFAGHLLWLTAMIALLQQALHRLAEHDEQREIFDALVRWPVTLIVPLMCCAMLQIAAVRAQPTGSISLIPGADLSMWFYRAVWWGGMLYLTCLLLRMLRVVRATSGRPSRVTTLYLLSGYVTLFALIARGASWLEPLTALRDVPGTARLLATVLVAVAAAVSWLGKMRSSRNLLRMTRTTRRARRRDTLESHRLRVMLSADNILDDQPRRREPEPPPLQQAS